MNESEERAYLEGKRLVYRDMLQTALTGLGRNSAEWKQHNHLIEREEAISRLREVCAQHGDNDWDDNLHLADIIEKHLGKHLDK